jgi:hypothetical protein
MPIAFLLVDPRLRALQEDTALQRLVREVRV